MIRICLIIALLLSISILKASESTPHDDPNKVFEEMYREIASVKRNYEAEKSGISERIKTINFQLGRETDLEKKVNLLIEKDFLKDSFRELEESEYTEVSKIRYIKGLQVLRILYEKILGLDHHFASVYTFSEITKMSNPNNYPQFQQVKELVRNKKNKKFNLELGGLLAGNPITSTAQTLINMLDIDLTSGEKRKELEEIECILDFTLSMHNELNTIYFETTYLQSGNQTLKGDIETLFVDYTKPIGYEQSLPECRSKDDWDEVRAKLDVYLQQIEIATGRDQFKKRVNIEFPIDRLLRFIDEYNNFIDQGEQFYRKFKIILNSYENADQCQSQLPQEYTKLKNDMDLAIEKFNVAYKPVEINGSKMKEILYGLNEFE
ncbi:MAG: hypothetical protein WCY25_06775 [Moheibacter sp.]